MDGTCACRARAPRQRSEDEGFQTRRKRKEDACEDAFDFQNFEFGAINTRENPRIHIYLPAVPKRDAQDLEIREWNRRFLRKRRKMFVNAEPQLLKTFPSMIASIEALDACWDITVDRQDPKCLVRAVVPTAQFLWIPRPYDGRAPSAIEDEVLPEEGSGDEKLAPAVADVTELDEHLRVVVDGELENLGGQLWDRLEARHEVAVLGLILVG